MKTYLIFILSIVCFATGLGVGTYIPAPIGDVTYCKSPQHEGDKTIAKLVMENEVLTLKCEYHSEKGNKKSSNIGERRK